ncbi:hypothetical protein Bbelb_318360 [Branchiostoma belcheri]|nr:hypothetical protein Bbelb_318360 [Branchiostoma belcheri]
MERPLREFRKEQILAKPRFVKQTQPIEDGPPNIKMEENDRQQANKDNITRPTNSENITATSSANVVRTVKPQTMFASAERLRSNHYMQNCDEKVTWVRPKSGRK